MSSFVVSIIICVVVGLMCMPVELKTIKRSASEETTICSRSTPCGWELYVPYQRTVQSFIKSPCECASGMRCIRFSDDISISAYVFRCRPTTEVELPSESSTEDY